MNIAIDRATISSAIRRLLPMAIMTAAFVSPVNAQPATAAGQHLSMPGMHDKSGTTPVPLKENVDVEFAKKMIAHHQEGVDMAKAELTAGRDPKMISAAKKIIAVQTKEIEQFNAWLNKHPHPSMVLEPGGAKK